MTDESIQPTLGLRVRRTAPHKEIPLGMEGTIDVVDKNGHDFWVATDEGGFCGWTTFDQWAPISKTP